MNEPSISEYRLERFVLGELSEDGMAEISGRLAADPRLRERVGEIKGSDAEILAQYPPERIAPRIAARAAGGLRRPSAASPSHMARALLASAALASVLLAVLFVLPRPARNRDGPVPLSPDREHTRLKGGAPPVSPAAQLLIHRKRNDHVEVLKNGVRGQAGDLLQLAYFSAAEPYGTILSIDGAGRVTLHFPESRLTPTNLVTGQQILLAYSIELDDAPGFERFFFVTSRVPFSLEEVLKAAADLAGEKGRARHGKLRLPPAYHQHSVIIVKGGLE